MLCGLPAHDETVAVARVAAASGKSLHEVLEWNRQVDYTATAYRVAARGRIQAPGGPVGAGRLCGWHVLKDGLRWGVAGLCWLAEPSFWAVAYNPTQSRLGGQVLQQPG